MSSKQEIFDLLNTIKNDNNIIIEKKQRLTKNEEYLLNMINELKEENTELKNNFHLVINKYDSLIKSFENLNNDIRNEIKIISDKNNELTNELENNYIIDNELGFSERGYCNIINFIPKNIDKIKFIQLFHHQKDNTSSSIICYYDNGNYGNYMYYKICHGRSFLDIIKYESMLHIKNLFEKINIKEITFDDDNIINVYSLNEQIEIVEHYLLSHPNKNIKLSKKLNFNDNINIILEKLEKYNNFSLIIEIDKLNKIDTIKNYMHKFKNIKYDIYFNISNYNELNLIPNDINYIIIKNDVQIIIDKLMNNKINNKNIVVILNIDTSIKNNKEFINNILNRYKSYLDKRNIKINFIYEHLYH